MYKLGDTLLILLVYVDDILIIDNNFVALSKLVTWIAALLLKTLVPYISSFRSFSRY